MIAEKAGWTGGLYTKLLAALLSTLGYHPVDKGHLE